MRGSRAKDSRTRNQYRVKHRHWLLSPLLLSNLLWATDGIDAVDGPIDEGFLAFLGQWETAEGEWVPPEELAALPIDIEDNGPAGNDGSSEEEIFAKDHEKIDDPN